MRHAELSDKWLLQIHGPESLKAGLVCQIHNSYARGSEPGWLSGDHEGEKVVVLSVFDPMNDRFSSRARIKAYGKAGSTQLPEIPVIYLQPVPPDQAGDEVLFLSGDHKGSLAKVKEINANQALVIVAGSHLLLETAPKQLCKRIPNP